MKCRWIVLFALAAIPFSGSSQVLAPVEVTTNTTIRVMAANLTSGNNQRYETPGLNIMKGLKPDVIAIQEFNYQSSTHGLNTANGFREMIDNTFGTNFVYVRETGKSIPNGVISRYPILASGVWDDPQVNDREFIWARLDIPGTNDLYVVSVHLHSGGGASSRSIEANHLKTNIQVNFPTNAYVILAGDFNTDTRNEAAMTTFKTFLSDDRKPADQAGNENTNANRNKPYDYVLPNFLLSSNQVPTIIGNASVANGLVFDSRVFTPLSAVPPVQTSDSAAFQMQHMAVIKDFKILYSITNYVTVTAPSLTLSNSTIRWFGPSNISYRVDASTNLSQ
ncbi:MAG: endonuclease/exonuclease/phosphatase family protein, partial [Limisphaerales bacterium]